MDGETYKRTDERMDRWTNTLKKTMKPAIWPN